eukprot:595664-Pelagomonas_calceolata.AAC.1
MSTFLAKVSYWPGQQLEAASGSMQTFARILAGMLQNYPPSFWCMDSLHSLAHTQEDCADSDLGTLKLFA